MFRLCSENITSNEHFSLYSDFQDSQMSCLHTQHKDLTLSNYGFTAILVTFYIGWQISTWCWYNMVSINQSLISEMQKCLCFESLLCINFLKSDICASRVTSNNENIGMSLKLPGTFNNFWVYHWQVEAFLPNYKICPLIVSKWHSLVQTTESSQGHTTACTTSSTIEHRQFIWNMEKYQGKTKLSFSCLMLLHFTLNVNGWDHYH